MQELLLIFVVEADSEQICSDSKPLDKRKNLERIDAAGVRVAIGKNGDKRVVKTADSFEKPVGYGRRFVFSFFGVRDFFLQSHEIEIFAGNVQRGEQCEEREKHAIAH